MKKEELIAEVERCGSHLDLFRMKEEILIHLKGKDKKKRGDF